VKSTVRNAINTAPQRQDKVVVGTTSLLSMSISQMEERHGKGRRSRQA